MNFLFVLMIAGSNTDLVGRTSTEVDALVYKDSKSCEKDKIRLYREYYGRYANLLLTCVGREIQ